MPYILIFFPDVIIKLMSIKVSSLGIKYFYAKYFLIENEKMIEKNRYCSFNSMYNA